MGAITIKWNNCDKGLKDCNPFFGHFHFFIESLIEKIFAWNLLQHVIKNTYNLFHTLFLINFWWITKNFLKMYKFYQIMCFVLKNHPNFKLHENMLISLWFIFLYHKIKLCFRCHVHTPHWHVVKDSWNLKIIFNRFLIFKNFSSKNFKLWVCFLNVGNQ
jgi:hypothetical protein